MVVRATTILSSLLFALILASTYTSEQFVEGVGFTVPITILIGSLIVVNIFLGED